MSAQPKPPNLVLLLGAGAIQTMAFPLALVLNFMRPDLMKPMLDHVYGYLLVLVIAVLTGVGTAVTLFVISAKQEKVGLQLGLSVGAFFLCTLPSVFLVLFGPIVFAFMFGNVGG